MPAGCSGPRLFRALTRERRGASRRNFCTKNGENSCIRTERVLHTGQEICKREYLNYYKMQICISRKKLKNRDRNRNGSNPEDWLNFNGIAITGGTEKIEKAYGTWHIYCSLLVVRLSSALLTESQTERNKHGEERIYYKIG